MKLPKSLTKIGDEAFAGCRNLSNIAISKEITSIGKSTFAKCDRLTDIYYAGSESDWSFISIEDNNEYFTSATVHYNSTGPTAEELAVIMESVNLNSIPDSAFSEDEQLSHMSSMEQAFTELPTDEVLSTLSFTAGSGQQIQSKFSNLVANEEYVLIVARDITVDNLCAVDNLLYIVQGTADTSGSYLSSTSFRKVWMSAVFMPAYLASQIKILLMRQLLSTRRFTMEWLRRRSR